ncbi:MAG TPA: hypothetical protein VGU66_07650 [Candidatus Elarobacter sp.]|nr:hypothetical protein [Candidatus Elarobacter sp.]
MSKYDDSGRDVGSDDDFEKKARQRFEQLTKPELSLPQYIEHQKTEVQRRAALERDASLQYKPTIGTATPCGNGDFENALDPAEWQGAYGTFLAPSPTNTAPGQTIVFGTLTSGIASGPVTLATSHQTWVSAGLDPTLAGLSPAVNLPTTAQGSSGAVRIGNSVNGWGCELLSKTFVVTPAQSTVCFWYAVVLEDPGHPFYAQPFFWVRVTDAAGNIVPGAFDFGSGSDRLVADSTNPFFQKASGGAIVYRDWTCAQIDLSSQVEKQVTVEFVTGDCGFGGHWGYAYIDSFCGDCKGSPAGDLTYDCEQSTHCGEGRICFGYELPKIVTPGAFITGSVTITLNIYQNGVLLTQLTSPVLTTGDTYCFLLSPSAIPGIDPSLGGFDFVATGAFAITTGSTTTPLGHMTVGAAPDGVSPGRNNDYAIACRTCSDIEHDQAAYLSKRCASKFNVLPRVSCRCPDAAPTSGDCHCDCTAAPLPDLQPCISVAWGDSKCDCMETDDVEIMCITVCNCYSNVTFNDLTIGQIRITDMAGNPVAALPDGTPSVQVVPSGPVCFGDIGPCKGHNQPTCVSRELVVYTRGAVGKNYRLSFEGVCFSVSHSVQSEQCFVLTLCQD